MIHCCISVINYYLNLMSDEIMGSLVLNHKNHSQGFKQVSSVLRWPQHFHPNPSLSLSLSLSLCYEFDWRGICVQNVLDSLVLALLADQNRKFIYVEQASFLVQLIFLILKISYIIVLSLVDEDTLGKRWKLNF